ncbi:GNAT family N-acetyltransferase [Paenibacillus sp. V4I5]|uniref:GNAT family N-acetyltransferase n=1 Tax=Paenibacillus sp. V4I5 TaxID=3042306 RepID=UPI002794A11C|nr:GNAT family N-acetyltransferase [Paenibacillus sp. V4I5]MDQ0920222.1 GNAT superfamily N-acetyltransferase [Paenibacillus sp. V4I5]
MRTVKLKPSHLEGICELWNREIGSDFPLRTRLLHQNSLSHPDFLSEGSFVVEEESSDYTVGVVISKVQRFGVGYISILLVDSRYRNLGIGDTLLKLAEKALKDVGMSSIALGGDSGHFFPGVPSQYVGTKRWFEKRGFKQRGSTYDLLGDFRGKVLVENDVGPEVTLSVAGEADREDLLAFMNIYFPGRWKETTNRYLALGGTGREFVLMRKSGKIIGFYRINDEYSPTLAGNQFWSPCFQEPCGGIGPLGIAAPYRGYGYGIAVLQAGMRVLQEQNHHLMVIDWTTEVDFYAKTGFSIWKTYHLYAKEDHS